MATKQFNHDIDLVLVGQFKGRVHNLTTSARTTFGGTLSSSHKGLHVYDTDEGYSYYWTGSAWSSGVQPLAGAMVYVGDHGSLTTAPSSPLVGYTYKLTVSGTLTWSGQTFNPNAVVQSGDSIIYRGSNAWDVYQGDADEATNSALGLVQLGTQAVINLGANQTQVVTAETLTGFANAKQFAKAYFAGSITLVADTPLTVTHNLNLSNRDAFVCSVKDSGNSEVSVDIDSVDANSLTITSSVAATGIKISVIGF